MKIKCNVTQCEFNKNNLCINDEIEIDFYDYEYECACCSKYKQSLDDMRNYYYMEKIINKDICNADYIIFSKNTDILPMDCFEAIIEDLIKDGNTEEVNIIIDMLLARGNSHEERYIKCSIDCKGKDIKQDNINGNFNCFPSPKDSELRKYSAKYYSQYPNLIEHSILNSVQKKMILKGMGI